jgi:enterochelin esterase family protein
MRAVFVITIALLVGSGESRADALRSPRLAMLAKKVAAHDAGAEDAFWRQLAAEGTPIVEDIHEPGRLLVTFVWHGNAATKHVELGGPDNSELSRLPGSNVFAFSLSLPDTGRFTYYFMIDHDPQTEPRMEQSRRDPLNKHPYEPWSSFLQMPHAPEQSSLVAHRGVALGSLWHHTIPAAKPQGERHLYVYTPPGYSPKGPAYPLLVAFDAEAAIGYMPLPLILDELIAAKRIPPVVALLIGNVDRGHDLMPNPAFADLVALDLVPWVRDHYHATSDPQRTVISGISLGGLASAYSAFRHPEVFGNVLSQSGSFWWGPDHGEPEATSHDFATTPRLPLRFWMEVGMFEPGARRKETTQIAANRHLRDVLLARGYDVAYREFPGDHAYVSWRGTIAEGLVALFGKPPKLAPLSKRGLAHRAAIDITPAQRSSLPWLVHTALLDGGESALTAAKKLLTANPEGYVVDQMEIDLAAGTVLLLDDGRASLPLYQWNTERFPQSPDTWANLGWAYFALGDRSHAAEYVKKWLALDPKNPDAASMLEELSAPH